MKKKISPETIEKIKDLAQSGLTKRRISEQLNLSSYYIKKYSEKTWYRKISDELREKIRTECKKSDKTKIEITKELIAQGYDVSYDNIRYYTKDITKPRNSPSKQLIEKMKTEVQNGKTKRQIAFEMQIPYSTVRYYTILIPSRSRKYVMKSSNDFMAKSPKSYRYYLSDEIIQRIRESIKEGKSRYQVMRETKVSINTINRITADLPVLSYGWPGLRGKTLELLQQVVKNGYVILPTYHNFYKNHYMTLRKYFPTVRKRVIRFGSNGMTIVFLKDRGLEAMWAVMERINENRIISGKKYRELIEIFIPGKNRREKKKNLSKNR